MRWWEYLGLALTYLIITAMIVGPLIVMAFGPDDIECMLVTCGE